MLVDMYYYIHLTIIDDLDHLDHIVLNIEYLIFNLHTILDIDYILLYFIHSHSSMCIVLDLFIKHTENFVLFKRYIDQKMNSDLENLNWMYIVSVRYIDYYIAEEKLIDMY